MTNQRFNGLALLNVHKECIDQLDLMNSDANFLGNIPKTNFRFCLICFVFLLKQIFHYKKSKKQGSQAATKFVLLFQARTYYWEN